MTRRFVFAAVGSLLIVALFAGCACHPHRRCWRPFQSTCPNRCAPPCASCPGGALPPPGAVPGAPIPSVAPAGVGALPPAPEPTPSNIPGAAPGGAFNPGPGAAIPNPDDVRRYGPSTSQYAWQAPGNAGVYLSGPDTSVPRDNVRLQSPEPPTAQPGVAERRAVPPVTIPAFAVVVPERIIAGQKPTLEGLDWLHKNGYRTVVQVTRAGEKDSARKAVEARGLKYLALEVSTAELGRAVEEFNRILADNANLPLFVYDRDGALAGALWYLHFRTADQLPDADARARAKSLGLREEATGENATLWVAIQDYLRKSGR